jgi:lipid-binding SYLF domain-containing protein
MHSMSRALAVFAAVLLAGALAGCGVTPETRSATSAQTRSAEQTLANFQNDPEMRWFRENVARARAVIICPQVARAGFIFGGSGGEALVLAREGDRWRGPAFYNMGAGSVGFQIGVEVSEVVILVMTEKALNALLSRSVKLGGDASIAAGPVGVGTSATVNSDMISFARSKGAFAGLSLEGAVIAPDEGANKAFWGSGITPTDILVRGGTGNPGAAESLQQALARVGR